MATSPNPFIQEDGKKPTCIEMLQLVVDNQATAEQRTYFMQHMDHCRPCYKEYNIETAIQELLKTKCKDGDCPEELAMQIKLKINSMSA